MPLSLLAASQAAITCAHVLPMEPPLGGGRGRCRRWRAPTSHKGPIGAVHRFPRRRGRPRGPRGSSGLHTPPPQRQMLAIPRRTEEANRGGAVTGAPTWRTHGGVAAGGKPIVHELKWSAEGTDPPGARQNRPMRASTTGCVLGILGQRGECELFASQPKFGGSVSAP